MGAQLVPFFSLPPPSPAPSPIQLQPQLVTSTRPLLAPALSRWGRRPLLPGIRGSLTCSSRLSPARGQRGNSVLPSSGQALSPSSEAAEKVAASARSTSSVRLSPTAQPAWDSSRGAGAGPGLPGRSHSPKSEAPGRRQLKVQVSGARGWGLLGPFALSRGGCWAPALTRVSGGGLRHTL